MLAQGIPYRGPSPGALAEADNRPDNGTNFFSSGFCLVFGFREGNATIANAAAKTTTALITGLPPVEILHPYPDARFAAKYPNILGRNRVR